MGAVLWGVSLVQVPGEEKQRLVTEFLTWPLGSSSQKCSSQPGLMFLYLGAVSGGLCLFDGVTVPLCSQKEDRIMQCFHHHRRGK